MAPLEQGEVASERLLEAEIKPRGTLRGATMDTGGGFFGEFWTLHPG